MDDIKPKAYRGEHCTWSEDNIQSMRMGMTPSLLPNNLAVCSEAIAFVHKNRVLVADASAVGRDDVSPSTARVTEVDSVQLLNSVTWVGLNGHPVLVVGFRGGLEVWEAVGSCRRLFEYHSPATAVEVERGVESSFCVGGASSRDGRRIVVGTSSGSLLVLDVEEGGHGRLSVKEEVSVGAAPVSVVASNVAGPGSGVATVEGGHELLAACTESGDIKVWDFGSMRSVGHVVGSGDGIVGLAFATPSVLVAATESGKVILYYVDVDGEPSTILPKKSEALAHTRCVTALDTDPSGLSGEFSAGRAVTTAEDGTIIVWNIITDADGPSLKPLFVCEVLDHLLTGVRFDRASIPTEAETPPDRLPPRNIITNAYDIYPFRIFRK